MPVDQGQPNATLSSLSTAAEESEEQRDHGHGVTMLGMGLVVFHAAADHARDRAAEGECGGSKEEEVRDEAEERILAAAQEGQRAGNATDEGDDSDGDDEAVILAEVFAITGDGGELTGPEGDGSSGVGLDGEEAGLEERGENEESATAGDGVDEAAEAGRSGQKDVVEGGGVHCLQVTGIRLQVAGYGLPVRMVAS